MESDLTVLIDIFCESFGYKKEDAEAVAVEILNAGYERTAFVQCTDE